MTVENVQLLITKNQKQEAIALLCSGLKCEIEEARLLVAALARTAPLLSLQSLGRIDLLERFFDGEWDIE